MKNKTVDIKPTLSTLTQPKESWEEELAETKFARLGGSCLECCDFEEMFAEIKKLIKNLLAREYERGRHDNIIDISTWKNIGEKRGYDKFLEKQERLNCPYCNPNTSYGASPEFFDQWKIKHEYHKTN